MAIESSRVRAEVVEATEFPDLANRYQVRAVPRTVVNGRRAFDGALPDDLYVGKILELATAESTPATPAR
jgi:predicted DsbA family dithiol-disulfide isomerase